MRSQNHPVILSIDRGGFSLYQDTLINIPRFNFTPDIVRDLDVINEGKLITLITTFIQINKIIPSNLGIILSDTVTYVKDLGESLVPQENIQNFLENIPFEEVIAKVIKIDRQARAVAVNKNLVMAIASVFTSKGCMLEAIIPSFLYGSAANFASGLTPGNIRVVLESSEIAKIGNLLTDQQKEVFPQNPEEKPKEISNKNEEKPQHRRQYVLIGIFIVLLVILAVVYLSSKDSASSVNVSVPSPTLTPTEVPPTPFSAISINSIRIKIIQSSQLVEKAANLKSELSNIGFQNITSEVSEISAAEKSSVIFPQNISADFKNKIVTEVRKSFPNAAVLENQSLDGIITILIGEPQNL